MSHNSKFQWCAPRGSIILILPLPHHVTVRKCTLHVFGQFWACDLVCILEHFARLWSIVYVLHRHEIQTRHCYLHIHCTCAYTTCIGLLSIWCKCHFHVNILNKQDVTFSTVRIGQFLLASATSGFSSYIKLAYCSSAQ